MNMQVQWPTYPECHTTFQCGEPSKGGKRKTREDMVRTQFTIFIGFCFQPFLAFPFIFSQVFFLSFPIPHPFPLFSLMPSHHFSFSHSLFFHFIFSSSFFLSLLCFHLCLWCHFAVFLCFSNFDSCPSVSLLFPLNFCVPIVRWLCLLAWWFRYIAVPLVPGTFFPISHSTSCGLMFWTWDIKSARDPSSPFL